MKNTPKARLNWLLGFINTDIATLNNVKLFGLWDELRTMAFGKLGPIAIPTGALVRWDERRGQAKEIQITLKDLLEEILTIYREKEWEKKIVPFYGPSDVAQGLGLEGIAPLVQLIMSYDLKEKPLPKNIRKRVPIVKQPELNVIVQEKVFPFFPQMRETLLSEFVLALSHFELALIQRCQREGCNGYFLKGTKKEKRFCSAKCYFAEAQRKRRERLKRVQKGKKRRVIYRPGDTNLLVRGKKGKGRSENWRP